MITREGKKQIHLSTHHKQELVKQPLFEEDTWDEGQLWLVRRRAWPGMPRKWWRIPESIVLPWISGYNGFSQLVLVSPPCQFSCDLSKGAPKEWSLEHWSATAPGLWWRTRKAHKLPIGTLHMDLFRKSSHLMCRSLTLPKFLHKYSSCGWLLYKS